MRRDTVIVGAARLDSLWFSNVWRLSTPDAEVARVRRIPSRHLSHGVLDGREIEIHPEKWGTTVIADASGEIGRIERRSWWGRRWEISGRGFHCELISNPLPRRWALRVGGHDMARISGSALSYNRLRVEADLSIPAWAVLLTWQVVARPWEAAASPRGLRPAERNEA